MPVKIYEKDLLKLKTNKERLDWIEDSIFARKLNFHIFLMVLACLLAYLEYQHSIRNDSKIENISIETIRSTE
jgi:hypothetical protein